VTIGQLGHEFLREFERFTNNLMNTDSALRTHPEVVEERRKYVARSNKDLKLFINSLDTFLTDDSDLKDLTASFEELFDICYLSTFD
jgi:hypothetical protein